MSQRAADAADHEDGVVVRLSIGCSKKRVRSVERFISTLDAEVTVRILIRTGLA